MIAFDGDRPGRDELLALYGRVGWTAYTAEPDRLCAAVAGSGFTRSARVDGRLIGFLRALTDGVTVVFVQDVLVDPDWQRRGVGRALMEDCLRAHAGVRQLVLLTDDRPETCAFYASLGLSDVSGLTRTRLRAFVRFAGVELD